MGAAGDSSAKEQVEKVHPAGPQPVPIAHDSFTGPDDSGEDLDLEPLEGLDSSYDESNDEAETGDRGNTSCAGKQKRGKSTSEAKLERMVRQSWLRIRNIKGLIPEGVGVKES